MIERLGLVLIIIGAAVFAGGAAHDGICFGCDEHGWSSAFVGLLWGAGGGLYVFGRIL